MEMERCDLNVGANNSKHHTELFGEERLIVRRGQHFDLTLHVKPDGSKFTLDDNTFSLIAKTGKPPPLGCKLATMVLNCLSLLLTCKLSSASPKKGPSPTKESGTLVTFGLNQLTDETQWSALASYGPTENTVLVSVTPPPDAPIGQYTLTLDQQGNEISLGEFTLLYNAWCPSKFIHS